MCDVPVSTPIYCESPTLHLTSVFSLVARFYQRRTFCAFRFCFALAKVSTREKFTIYLDESEHQWDHRWNWLSEHSIKEAFANSSLNWNAFVKCTCKSCATTMVMWVRDHLTTQSRASLAHRPTRFPSIVRKFYAGFSIAHISKMSSRLWQLNQHKSLNRLRQRFHKLDSRQLTPTGDKTKILKCANVCEALRNKKPARLAFKRRLVN